MAPVVSRTSIAVKFQPQVMQDGEVVRTYPWQRNLTYDVGMNELNNRVLQSCATWGRVGTGTRPVKRDSGAITGLVVGGNEIVSSAAFFQASDVGRLIKFDSGDEFYITAFNSNQSVNISPSGSGGPSEFTVWYVDDTQMDTQTEETNSYRTDAGDNGYNITNNEVELTRTFLFPKPAANRVYTEVGWSWQAGALNNLFGRALFASSIAINTNQQLAVKVTLQLNLTPSTIQVGVNPTITGWPVAPATTTQGDQYILNINASEAAAREIVSLINSAGAGTGLGTGEPAGVLNPWIGNIAKPTNWGEGLGFNHQNLNFTGGAKGTYTPGDFTRDDSYTIGTGFFNATNINCILFSAVPGAFSSTVAFGHWFDENQTKASTHEMDLVFRKTWSRILVN